MKRVIRKNHFYWLTTALVGMLLTGAFTSEYPESMAFSILEYSSIALLLLSLIGLREDRLGRLGLLILIAIMALASIARYSTDYQHFHFVYMFVLLAFFLSAGWLVGKKVLLTGHVDLNIITGSVALYLILGFIWAILYTFLIQLSPDAISGVKSENWIYSLSTMTYFSFVTLTTLGYGDFSPVTPVAQVLVILEAVAGMFYLAILVASLIGSARDRKKS